MYILFLPVSLLCPLHFFLISSDFINVLKLIELIGIILNSQPSFSIIRHIYFYNKRTEKYFFGLFTFPFHKMIYTSILTNIRSNSVAILCFPSFFEPKKENQLVCNRDNLKWIHTRVLWWRTGKSAQLASEVRTCCLRSY